MRCSLLLRDRIAPDGMPSLLQHNRIAPDEMPSLFQHLILDYTVCLC